jgi:hypothetical protein
MKVRICFSLQNEKHNNRERIHAISYSSPCQAADPMEAARAAVAELLCSGFVKGHGFSRAVTGLTLHAPLGAEGGFPSAAEAGFIPGQFGMPEGMPFQNEATPTQKTI